MASSDDFAAWLVQKVADSIGKLFSEKDETVQNLKGVARDLNQMQKKVDVTNTVSSFGGIFGSALFLSGIIAAPVTGGMSAFATAGLMLSASSAGAMAFAAGYQWLKENESMKKVERNIEKYKSEHETFCKFVESINDVDLVNQMMKELEYLKIHRKVKDAVILILSSIKRGIQIRDRNGKFGMTRGILAAKTVLGAVQGAALSTGGRFLRVGGVGLSVLAVPLDIHTFVTSVVNLNKQEPSKTAAAINEVADELHDQSIVQITNDSETIQVLRGNNHDRVLDDDEYSRLIKQVCGNNTEIADAILT